MGLSVDVRNMLWLSILWRKLDTITRLGMGGKGRIGLMGLDQTGSNHLRALVGRGLGLRLGLGKGGRTGQEDL
jgi:hypothetical protein